MYIWNIKGLVQTLKEESQTQKQQKQYKILGIIVLSISLMSYPIYLLTETINKLDIIDMISYVVINLIGVYIAYRINKSGHNKGFWYRYFCLLLPIILRYWILSFSVTFIGYIILPFFVTLSDDTNWFDLLTSIGAEIYFNFLIVKYMKIVNE